MFVNEDLESTKLCCLSTVFTVWKNENFTLTKNISSNQHFSIFISTNVTFTKCLPKMHESKFPKFPHCARKKSKQKIFREKKSYEYCIKRISFSCILFIFCNMVPYSNTTIFDSIYIWLHIITMRLLLTLRKV